MCSQQQGSKLEQLTLNVGWGAAHPREVLQSVVL